jgi:nucleoside-diphosphate-sugar epimerase
MDRILITGGAGFIGLHLAEYFLKKNYQVDLADNFSRGMQDRTLKNILKNGNANLYALDLMDPVAVENTLPKDYIYIFHLAAIIGVANVLKQPFEVLRQNTILLLNVIEFAKKQKRLKRLLFASTSEVYAGTLSYFNMEIPTPETTPLAVTDLHEPRTSYMLSKIYGEALCNASGLPVTIFRPHNIYGPRMGMAHVIPELLKKTYFLKDGEGLEIFSPEHKRTFCYIDDAVKMLFLSARTETCLGQTINIGNHGPEITMYQLGEMILKTVEKDVPIISLSATEGSPARRCPNMSKTAELLGCKANISLNVGIQKTFDWYKTNMFDLSL